MARFGRLFCIVSTVLLGSIVSAPTTAADVFLMSSFQLHGYDEAMLEALGNQDGSIVYLSELASITREQLATRESYERLGCYPFNLVKDGAVVETGFNCQTFFCVGYTKGPKVCHDRNGRPYGGVVEINRRLSIIDIKEQRMSFASFPAEDQTAAMQQRIADLRQVLCAPYYVMLFDVAVAEGYACEEVGTYPYFANANDCANDWRDTDGLVCERPLQPDEFDRRRKAIEYRSGLEGSSSSATSSARSSVSSSVATSSHSSFAVTPYPDVLEGHYGYTAIMDLSRRGVIHGYSDGSYRPYNTINRAEFSKLFVGGLYEAQVHGEIGCFPDVAREWFSSYVCAAKRLAWIGGYPDGSFHPEQTITKAEAMKIIVASMGVPLDSTAELPPGTPDGEWFSPFIRKAMELNLILEPSFSPGAPATRADAAVWIYRSLKAMGK